jgi:hypothetical protein
MRRRRGSDDALLFGTDPAARLDAARALRPRDLHRLRTAAAGWPPLSPGALNAWMLLVTTKPPRWRDPLLSWPEQPLTAGTVHEGFLYPDPIGFWTEVRRWITTLARTRQPDWTMTEALAVAALVHLGDDTERLGFACDVCRPRVLLFLDEPSWTAAALRPARTEAHHVPDPHRAGQIYQGLWGRLEDGTIVGKAPQHPTMHRLYDVTDMSRFLTAVPSD